MRLLFADDGPREAERAEPGSSCSDAQSQERTCGICMEGLPQAAMHIIGGCMHQFCKGCLEQLIQTHMSNNPLPVQCPAVHCHNSIDVDECTVLLHTRADIDRLTQVSTAHMPFLWDGMLFPANGMAQKACDIGAEK